MGLSGRPGRLLSFLTLAPVSRIGSHFTNAQRSVSGSGTARRSDATQIMYVLLCFVRYGLICSLSLRFVLFCGRMLVKSHVFFMLCLMLPDVRLVFAFFVCLFVGRMLGRSCIYFLFYSGLSGILPGAVGLFYLISPFGRGLWSGLL